MNWQIYDGYLQCLEKSQSQVVIVCCFVTHIMSHWVIWSMVTIRMLISAALNYWGVTLLELPSPLLMKTFRHTTAWDFALWSRTHDLHKHPMLFSPRPLHVLPFCWPPSCLSQPASRPRQLLLWWDFSIQSRGTGPISQRRVGPALSQHLLAPSSRMFFNAEWLIID